MIVKDNESNLIATGPYDKIVSRSMRLNGDWDMAFNGWLLPTKK